MPSYRNPPALTSHGARLDGKVVLVTGASDGIGAAAVRRFAAEGAQVVAVARRADVLGAVVDDVRDAGGQAVAVAADVTDEDSIRAAVDHAVRVYGRLDGAFNNAGVQPTGKLLHEVDAAEFQAVIATNLFGVFLCMKHEMAAMQSAGGAIVNTTSTGGLVGGQRYADYAAAKFGVLGLVKCAAIEGASVGIRVNAVAPGPTDTAVLRAWARNEQDRAAVAASSPLNFIAHPDDIARAALFLLSDESRWTTGTTLVCDGGLTAQ